MKGLQGKRIVVAGSATGVGQAVARRLAEEGAFVIAGDINADALDQTVAGITSAGGRAEAVTFDLTDTPSCERMIERCVSVYGGIDGLANVAADLSVATSSRDTDLLDTPDDIWDRRIDANMIGYVRTMRAALPHMAAAKQGSIVNISSAAAHIGESVRVAYAATKLGLHAITRHVASRWGPDNIRCNAIAPGPVVSATFNERTSVAERDAMFSGVALRRGGDPAEVAAAVTFLLSDDATWITGQVISVNGGWTMRE